MKYRVSAVALGPVTMMPRKVRGGAVIVPDGLSLKNQPTLLNSHRMKNCAASVATAR